MNTRDLAKPVRPEQTARLRSMAAALFHHYGKQNWWPAQSRFEVIVGAFLTQNTNWRNVEKAMENLRGAGRLSMNGVRSCNLRELQELIRPSGFFRQKAARLKSFVAYVDKSYAGSLDRMFARPTPELRAELLACDGIGPETADSILNYAGGHEVFVVDAYTRRILERHGLATKGKQTKYEAIRGVFESTLISDPIELPASSHAPRHPPSRVSRTSHSKLAQTYNELHAMIVRVGVEHCRTKPQCEGCPLERFL